MSIERKNTTVNVIKEQRLQLDMCFVDPPYEMYQYRRGWNPDG